MKKEKLLQQLDKKFENDTYSKITLTFKTLALTKGKRVVFYIRVSTKHLAQIAALEMQKKWMDNFKRQHPEWEVVEYYIDYSTGTNSKRPEFKRMLVDARKNKFDYIITREVSRFGRNVRDALNITDSLREEYGIGVYFALDKLDTNIPADRSTLVSKANEAEENARRTSEKIKETIAMLRETGVIWGNDNVYGFMFDKENPGCYIQNKEQVDGIMFMKKCIMDGLSGKQIKEELELRGYKTASGKVRWNVGQIYRTLSNPIYAGYQYQNKTVILDEDFLDKRKTRIDKSDWVLVDLRDKIEVIFTLDEYIEIMNIIEKRRPSFLSAGKTCRKDKKVDLWHNLLLCDCGCSYRRDKKAVSRKKKETKGIDIEDKWSATYRCYNQINKGSLQQAEKKGLSTDGLCGISSISEWKLYLILERIYDTILLEADTDKLMKILEQCWTSEESDSSTEKKQLQNRLDKLKQEKAQLLRLKITADGDFDLEDFEEALEQVKQEIDDVKRRLNSIHEEKNGSNEDGIKKTEKMLSSLVEDNLFDENFIYQFINLIVHRKDNLYAWFLNFSEEVDEEDIPEKYKLRFIKKARNEIITITKDSRSKIKRIRITKKMAQDFKYKYDLGYVGQWDDILVDIYL